MSEEQAKVIRLVVETVIEAEVDAVWHALTDGIRAWWPADFYSGGDPETRSFHLEAEPGGRMYEAWGEDGGGLWATVISVEPGRRLDLAGHVTGRWGGPSTWIGELTLEAVEKGVRLHFQEDGFGRIGENYVAEKTKGWRFLFEGALGAHVEGREAPVWEDD